MNQNLNPFRAELEALWRKRLDEAADRHEVAKQNLRKVLDNLNQGLPTPPDGSDAVRQAALEETAARNEHMRMLKIFSDLLLHDKTPSSRDRS